MNFDTNCLHAGYRPGSGEPRNIPIIQSTTFRYETSEEMGRLFDLEAAGYFYTRLQNPTSDAVAARLCALEGGTAAMLLSSGQAASFFSIFNIASAGDHVVSSTAIYGGTYNLFAVTMKRMGIEFTFVDPDCTEDELNAAFRRLRGKGRITEADVREAMKEVRLALLDADVSYSVVKDFVAKVTERAVGSDVLESLTPAQQIIKIVDEELTVLMGGASAKLATASRPPTVIMMVGLQGAGKTTNGAKLAGLMKRQNSKRPLLVACDTFRPAAILEQFNSRCSHGVTAERIFSFFHAPS